MREVLGLESPSTGGVPCSAQKDRVCVSVALETDWAPGEVAVTIDKGLEVQVEGIQLATGYKYLGVSTKPTLSFSSVPNCWLLSENRRSRGLLNPVCILPWVHEVLLVMPPAELLFLP